MNEKCIYCKYLNKCFDKVEYNSFYCLTHRVFPKIVEKSYEELLEKNKQLKEQYCERTDCSGRLGNSKKVEQLQIENEQLKEQINQLKKELYASNISEEEWLEKSDK